MNFALKLCCLVLSLALVRRGESQGTCGGDCTSSIYCAENAGDINCRCTFFTCGLTPPCGGGCISDSQCYQWSDGNPNCVCTRWFECDLKRNLDKPSYKALLKMAEMAKRRKEGLNVVTN